MRITAFVLGGLLLIGGVTAVAVADQQRQDAIEQARIAVQVAQERRDAAQTENLELAEQLTTLRSKIADQHRDLDDTTGFLE